MFSQLVRYFGLWIGRRIYGTLHDDDLIEWDSRVVSNFHALVGGCMASWVMLFDPQWNDYRTAMGDEWLFLKSDAAQATVLFTISYMVYDLVAVFNFRAVLFEATIVAHHVACIIGFGFMYHSRTGLAYCLVYIVTEFTTPLVNARWFMTMTGKKGRPRYKWVMLALWVLWIVFRLPLVPIVYWHLRADWPILGNDWRGVWAGYIGYPAISLLNILWFVILSQKLYKIYTSGVGTTKIFSKAGATQKAKTQAVLRRSKRSGSIAKAKSG